jgi:hypothetical protein
MPLCRKHEPAIPAVKPGWIKKALKSMGSRELFIALFGFGLLLAPNAKSAGTDESAARVFATKGVVRDLSPDDLTVTISHEAISNYMERHDHAVQGQGNQGALSGACRRRSCLSAPRDPDGKLGGPISPKIGTVALEERQTRSRQPLNRRCRWFAKSVAGLPVHQRIGAGRQFE